MPLPKKIHDQVKRLGTVEEVERYFPGLKAFVDPTEQEIPKPKNAMKRETHYSGKRKEHTVKTQLTVNGKGPIVHKAPHARGRRHDLNVYRQRHPDLPNELEQDFDRGYDEIRNYFPDLKCDIPFKRRGHGRDHRDEKAEEHTPEQKSFNRELLKARVVVEHTISRLKKFNILVQEFWNRLRFCDTMTDIVPSMINTRIMRGR